MIHELFYEHLLRYTNLDDRQFFPLFSDDTRLVLQDIKQGITYRYEHHPHLETQISDGGVSVFSLHVHTSENKLIFKGYNAWMKSSKIGCYVSAIYQHATLAVDDLEIVVEYAKLGERVHTEFQVGVHNHLLLKVAAHLKKLLIDQPDYLRSLPASNRLC